MLRSARFRGVQKLSGGFSRPAGICQRVAETDLQGDYVDAVLSQFNGAAVIQSGPIKSQCARRFASRGLGMNGRAIFFARARIVFVERFRIVQTPRFKGLCQSTMNLAPLLVAK